MHDTAIGLGMDVGGTQTRWALANTAGELLAQGEQPGFSGLELGRPEGEQRVAALLAALAATLPASLIPRQLLVGVTGVGEANGPVAQKLRVLLADSLALAPSAIRLVSDIELAYLAMFAPGEGYLVYAGTGSIAAHIDAAGQFHRAGGYGGLLDDGGSGYWIAREALRLIWRQEDEAPGSWQHSAMARAVFAHIGGSDWASSRAFVYGASRGELGMLAMAVAQAADADPLARDILWSAGAELARLAAALAHRFGTKPVALAGRAASLHPVIANAMRACLPSDLPLLMAQQPAHLAAARLAASAPPVH